MTAPPFLYHSLLLCLQEIVRVQICRNWIIFIIEMQIFQVFLVSSLVCLKETRTSKADLLRPAQWILSLVLDLLISQDLLAIPLMYIVRLSPSFLLRLRLIIYNTSLIGNITDLTLIWSKLFGLELQHSWLQIARSLKRLWLRFDGDNIHCDASFSGLPSLFLLLAAEWQTTNGWLLSFLRSTNYHLNF